MTNESQPYKGLCSYEEEDHKIFWGRDDDIRNLVRSILNNSSTLIYGPSGSGKSSLIKAGLIPAMKNHLYVPIRVTPKECIQDKALMIWNRITDYIDNFLTNKPEEELLTAYWYNDDEIVPTHKFTKLSLWEKLNVVKYKNHDGAYVNFMIIIDQFEEIFQRNLNIKDIQNIFRTYEMMCGYNSFVSAERINDAAIVTVEAVEKYIEDIEEPSHRMVISIRQDFLYELETNASSYPVLHKNRIHVSLLNEEQAYKIICSSRKPDGTQWFNESQAREFIEDITGRSDFDFDGYPEIPVDPMMLSLYLQELCNNQSETGASAENILRDFYFKHMNFPKAEVLEQALLSSDARYRIPIPLNDAQKIISQDELDRLESCGILLETKKNDTPWIELRHDKLCEYAKMHINTRLTQERNIKNHSPLMYLTVHGRQEHENSYHIPKELPQNLSFLHFIKGGVLNAPDLNLDFSGLLQNSSLAHHCELSMRVKDKNDVDCVTEDEISEIGITIVEGKIYDICFRNQEHGPQELYFGPSGITFYYDSKGRVVLKDYYRLRKNNANHTYNKERVTLNNGYTSILYFYSGDSECPYLTAYLNIPEGKVVPSPKKDNFVWDMLKLYKCQHKDGNYGYLSEYDGFGCEVSRKFVGGCDDDKITTECAIAHGYSEVRFERFSNDSIKSISYYRLNEKYAFGLIHKREYLYSSDNQQIIGERAYDIDGKLLVHEGGISHSDIINEPNLILIKNNEDAEIAYQVVITNAMSQPECILNLDSEMNQIGYDVKYNLYAPNGLLIDRFTVTAYIYNLSISKIIKHTTVKDGNAITVFLKANPGYSVKSVDYTDETKTRLRIEVLYVTDTRHKRTITFEINVKDLKIEEEDAKNNWVSELQRLLETSLEEFMSTDESQHEAIFPPVKSETLYNIDDPEASDPSNPIVSSLLLGMINLKAIINKGTK